MRRQQLWNYAGDLTKISLVGDYAMLKNLCKSRTQLPKWKCGKEIRVDKHPCWRVENAHQILARDGVDPRLSADRGVDHGDQSGGNMDDRNSAHEGGGDEACQVADDPASERDYGGVAAESLGEHLVGEPRPCFPGFVGLAGRDGEGLDQALLELTLNFGGVQGLNVRVGDERVPVGWCELPDVRCDLGQQTRGDDDGVAAEPDLTGRRIVGPRRTGGVLAAGYQVTSPAPVRTFATRASMKRRSDSRLR